MVRVTVVVTSAFVAACSYTPAHQEKERVERALSGVGGVVMSTVECGSKVFAADQWCAEVIMKDGAKLRFSRVGLNSFGGTATNVVVDEAGSLVARVASCRGISSPNFHRDGAFGHHIHPRLLDVREALVRHREIVRELQWWPQCPQYFDVQDQRGENFRYCARAKGATEEPPRPSNCS